MPGIELSRFIDIGDNEEDLLCGICHSVFVNPMVTQCCQQTYCNDCVNQWMNTYKKCPNQAECSAILTRLSAKKLTQPPRVLINLLNKLRLSCDFVEEGCMEQVVYGRYKQHVRDCHYNPKLICNECGVKNGKISEHNCVDNLVLRHQCLQVLQTSNNVLEASNKKLTDEKLNSDKQLTDLKKKYDENIKVINELLALKDSMNQKNKRLDVNNKELSEKCKRFELEILNLKTSLNEMNASLNDLNEKNNNLDANNNNITDEFDRESVNISKSNQKIKKEMNECEESIPSKLVKRNKRLSDKCNGYINEISDLKSKSYDTITELNETIKQKNEQFEKFTSMIEINKRLEEYNRIMKRNIGNLCLIKQTNLEKTSLELKINDINLLRRQVIDGEMIRIRDFMWNLRAKFIVEYNVEYLSFYLVCNGNRMDSSIIWSCIASFEMSIKPLRKVLIADNNVLKRSRFYTNNDNCFGFDKFMPWLMVIDEKNGYVKDTSILLKVCLSVWN